MFSGFVDGQEFDVIIVGAGPSGSSCATFLAKAGKNVLLIDKAKFPRDKICGDGISGKSLKVLQELGVMPAMEKAEHIKMYGVTFSSPKGRVVKIPSRGKEGDKPPGFVARREVFDNVIFQNAKKYSHTFEQFQVSDLLLEGDQVVGVTGIDLQTKKKYSFKAKVVVGADGAASVISNKVKYDNFDDNHQIVAVRAYYSGVKDLNDTIELHFVDELIPGYFWIFPEANGMANVGAGMIVRDMKAKKVNLQEAMQKAMDNNPLFKERFKDAKLISPIRSWSLPVGSKHKKAHGNGFILVGDAASLIDPFTGEGIGNALTSGKIAAESIVKAFAKNDFSAASLKDYEDTLWKEVGTELKTSYKMQKMGQNTFLLNLIIDKASRSKTVQEAISNSLLNPSNRDIFYSPMFYLKVLFS
ncbi:MAG: geranylgeranyl reductase family protein [Candidatus Micrarchaeota archaeon]